MIQNRRQMMLAAGAALFGPTLLATVGNGASARATKKVLFFTKSSGFPHPVITRLGDKTSFADKILIEIGKEHGFEVVASKDGGMFEPDQIGQWDAFVFMTTGDLTKKGTDQQPPMTEAGLKGFLDAIDAGKGFVGMHCATDTFGNHRKQGGTDPYIKMIGGHFSGHGPQQVAKIEIADPKFPGVKGFGTGSFELNDEWYGQMFLADDLHVILTQVTNGMNGKDYERGNYPETWARLQGKGRVFYTSMGHREDVWQNPKFQDLLLGALAWTTGQIDADVTPNIGTVTPEYRQIHREPAAKAE